MSWKDCCPRGQSVDANHRDKSGQTALMYTGIQNMPEFSEPLLPDSRVDLRIRNHSGTAPLGVASWHRDQFMVTQLFEYSDIDVSLQNVDGETASCIAEACLSASTGPGFVAGRNATQGREGNE